MDYKRLLKPFKKKVLAECVLKALLFSLMTGAMSVFIVSLIYHIRVTEAPVNILVITGLIVFAVSFLIYLIVRYPNMKKVASRVDELGLEERVSTMVEFRDSKEEMASLQRTDAVEKIGTVTPKEIRFRFLKREFILLAVSVVLAVVMLILPYDLFASSVSAETISEEQQEIIRNLISELRENVKDADISDELKSELDKIIDNLEEELQNASSELEQAAEIDKAKKEMEELLEESLTKNRIGEALQRYELTRTLGEAISKGDTDKVSSALDTLKDTVEEDKTLVSELGTTLSLALEKSGVDADDELYSAIASFSENLLSIDTGKDDADTIIDAAFSEAKEKINAALEKQNKIEEEQQALENAMDDAKDDVLGNEKEDPSGGESMGESGESGEQPENGEKPSGDEQPSGTPEGEPPEGGGEVQGDGETGGNQMTEGIYDPISGNVSYGEVFAAYYAEYLASLESGEVPEDLETILNEYYSSLNN